MFSRDKTIVDTLLIDNKPDMSRLRMKRYMRIREYLKSLDPWITSFTEALLRLKYNISRNCCIECGKPTYFKGYRYYIETGKLYADYCSAKCRATSPIYKKHYEEACVKKYGVDNPMKVKSVVDKGKETCKKRYGYVRASYLKEYQEKAMSTCYANTGAYIPILSPSIKERIHSTCYERYGSYSPLGNRDIFEQTVETTYKKYGVKCVFNREDLRAKANSEEAMMKRYATMKKHHTFSTSQPEEDLYLYMKEKFPDVQRQYRDKQRYPFRCDFYIPSLDLFIELNAHWTHNTHPYDPNNIEDQKKAEEWKSKHKRFYDNAVRCWTVTDVKKRETAKKNNLYYKEVWTLEEGKKLVDELSSS